MNKRLILLCLLVLITASFAGPARAAEKYPARPITMLVAFGAGGASDILARAFADYASEYLGQPLVVVNRPGIGGFIGTTEFKNARKDGYHILFTANSMFTTQPFLRPTQYKLEDFRPIAGINIEYSFFCVPASAPYDTFAGMVEHFKKQGGAVRYAHTGTGGIYHLTQEVLLKKAGLTPQGVPFGGSAELLSNLLGGHVDATNLDPVAAHTYVSSKQIKILGQFAAERGENELLKDVPTFREQGYDVSMQIFKFIAAPAGIPDDRFAFLEEAFAKVFADKRWAEFCEKFYNVPFYANGQGVLDKLVPEIEDTRKLLIEMGLTKQ